MRFRLGFSDRAGGAGALIRRELKSTFRYGIGIYLATSLSLIAASFLLKNAMESVKGERVLMMSDPLNFPLFISVLICSFYLSASSSISISREKERRTLEVLFYGPIDHISYILGKYVKEMLSYFAVILFLIAYFLITSLLTNFAFSYKFVQLVFLSVFLASCMITFGIFLSTLTSGIRSSIILFFGVVIGLLAVQLLHQFLGGAKPEYLSAPMLYLKGVVEFLQEVFLRWISPFSYLSRGSDSVKRGDIGEYVMSIVSSVIYSLVMILLSILILKRKGVIVS